MVAPSPQTILLVDGYNVIGAWPKMQRIKERVGLEEARQGLIERLSNYSAFHGCPTKIVFDAHYQQRMGMQEQITEHLEVHFTDAGQTADSYIEVFCSQARHQITEFQRIIVATSDRDQYLTVMGYGAEWMSSHLLIQDIKGTERKISDRTKKPKKTSRQFLASVIDPEAKRKLERLRFGLDPDI